MAEHDDLIERILAGDSEALAEYVERRRDWLLGFLSSQMSSQLKLVVDPEDLLQEVVTSAMTALSKIPRGELTVDSWLMLLSRRRIVDCHRRYVVAEKRTASKARSIHGSPEDSSAPEFEQMLIASMTSPSAVVSREFKLQRIQAAVEKLSPEQKQLIQLKFVDNLSSRDIAERMGKSEVAVRVMLSRTLLRLQAMTKDAGG